MVQFVLLERRTFSLATGSVGESVDSDPVIDLVDIRFDVGIVHVIIIVRWRFVTRLILAVIVDESICPESSSITCY